MQFPFKQILLATEGSEFDIGAERVGIELAAGSERALNVVLPLVSNPVYQSLAPELEEEVEVAAAAKLAELRRRAREKGVALTATVRRGEEPFREIVDAAREYRADLIVLRRRGQRSYLANLLLGEMVHTVIGHAPCDVLIVPRAASLWCNAIVFATDGSPHSDRATEIAAALAVRYGLPMSIVSVAEKGTLQTGGEAAAKANVEAAVRTAEAMGARATGHIVIDEKPYQIVLATAMDVGADLIVIGRRGLGRVKHMLLGSSSEQVASRAACPVLIVQQTGAPVPR
jgi:nucleotide-binding universal stress UspA family protein